MGTVTRQHVRVFSMFAVGLVMTQLAYVFVALNDTAMLAATTLMVVALTLAMILEAQNS